MRRGLDVGARVKHEISIICTELKRIFDMGLCDAKDLDAIKAYSTSQTNQLVIGNAFDIPSGDIDTRTMHSWSNIIGEARNIIICKCGLNKVRHR